MLLSRQYFSQWIVSLGGIPVIAVAIAHAVVSKGKLIALSVLRMAVSSTFFFTIYLYKDFSTYEINLFFELQGKNI